MKELETYTYKGFTGSLYDIAKTFGFNNSTLRLRLKKGLKIEEAIEKPIKLANKDIYTYKGFTGSLYKTAKHFNIKYSILNRRIKSGFGIEEAIETEVIKNKVYTYHNFTVGGFTDNLTQIAQKYGMNSFTLRKRINSGMTIEEAVETPVRPLRKNIFTYKDFTGNASQIAKKFNINYRTLCRRVYSGMTIEEAIEKLKIK